MVVGAALNNKPQVLRHENLATQNLELTRSGPAIKAGSNLPQAVIDYSQALTQHHEALNQAQKAPIDTGVASGSLRTADVTPMASTQLATTVTKVGDTATYGALTGAVRTDTEGGSGGGGGGAGTNDQGSNNGGGEHPTNAEVWQGIVGIFPTEEAA